MLFQKIFRARFLVRILIVIFTLLVFEGYVRFFVVSPVAVVFDPDLGPMKAPFSRILRTYEGFNHYTTDAYGFNNDALGALPKHRLLVLGDSFVEAKHVSREQNFVSILNALPNVLAYNAGYSGADPRSFPVLVRRFLPIIQPTQLILCVNADDLTALNTTALPKYESPSGMKAWLQPLFAHSALATHLNWKYKPVFQDWWQSLHKHHAAKHQSKGFSQFSKHWAEIIDTLQSFNIPMMVVVLPSLHYENGKVITIPDRREEILANVAQAKGVQVIRTERAFVQDFKKQGEVAFGFMNSHLGTGHLNIEGHQIVAGVIRQALGLKP